MLYERFMKRVATLGGLVHEERAEPIVRATLAALRTCLPDVHAELVARELPARLAELLRAGHFERSLTWEELRTRLAEAEGVPMGYAMEQLEVVCRVLGEALSDTASSYLHDCLPPPLQTELARPDEESEPITARRDARAEDVVEPRSRPGHTLADGRPGSTKPVSRSRPPEGHTHSVAVSPEPHTDSKLSSAPGLTQRVLRDDLAEAKPHTKRTLATG